MPAARRRAAGAARRDRASRSRSASGIFHGEGATAPAAAATASDGKGTPVGADLTSGKWLWGDGSLAGIEQTIATGVPEPKEHPGAMPPMGGVELSPADLKAVAAYVWALGQRQN